MTWDAPRARRSASPPAPALTSRAAGAIDGTMEYVHRISDGHRRAALEALRAAAPAAADLDQGGDPHEWEVHANRKDGTFELLATGGPRGGWASVKLHGAAGPEDDAASVVRRWTNALATVDPAATRRAAVMERRRAVQVAYCLKKEGSVGRVQPGDPCSPAKIRVTPGDGNGVRRLEVGGEAADEGAAEMPAELARLLTDDAVVHVVGFEEEGMIEVRFGPAPGFTVRHMDPIETLRGLAELEIAELMPID